jgi:uncharacterized protein with PIN domain
VEEAERLIREFAAEFRFYEELNDFLPVRQRRQTVRYAFNGRPAIKDPIEALGVPHTEVDLIVVNGQSVGFDYHLQDGDRVAVYPCFEAFDLSPIVKLRESPLRQTAFILDVHLGKLARFLRLLGFDALYRNDYDDDELVQISAREHRILLTRDRRLLFHKTITHGYFLHSTNAMEQTREVIERFDLTGNVRLFTRCSECNGAIAPVAKEAVLDRLQPLTRRHFHEFVQCAGCGRVYWKGSHYGRLAARLSRVVGSMD